MKRSVIIFPDRAGQLACHWACWDPFPPLTGGIDVPLWHIGNAARLDALVPEPCYRKTRKHRRKYQGQAPHAHDDNGEDGDLSHLG